MINAYSRPWTILLLEDDEDDYILAMSWLNSVRRGRFELLWAQNQEEALAILANRVLDVILVDYDLGAFNGLDFVREALKYGCHAPIIMLTGRGGYEIDLLAQQTGVTDYLNKGEITPHLLERTIRYGIEWKQSEMALREANRLLEASNQDLEERVKKRTEELMANNQELMDQIVHRKRIEAELGEVRRRLLERAEAERLELAQDLHDGPMQNLYALSYQLASLEKKAAEPSVKEGAISCQEKLLEVIADLRATAGELRPPALAPYGLEKAIRSHIETISSSHPELNIHLELEPDENTLPESLRLTLFRIYQVALTNVLRHAGARNVTVQLAMNSHEVILEISDDGRGFDVPESWFQFAHEGHLGLVGAIERANAVGARLEVDSAPGKGTRLRVTAVYARR
jgi:signal transduction histidine kinase